MAHQDMAARLPALLGLAVLAALLSGVVVRRMIRVGVLDVPGSRSSHDRPTPKGGGAGVVAAVMAGVPAALLLLPGQSGERPATLLLLLAVLLLAVVSWADDLRQFGFQIKLAAQAAAGSLAIGAVAVLLPTHLPCVMVLPLVLASLCWLLLATNAFNFIDGLNGLASGSGLIASVAVGWLAWRLQNPLLSAAAIMTAAGLAGFLPFNYPRARIFLGDVGSQACGLLLGAFALLLAASGGRDGTSLGLGLLVPLALAGILWDVVFTLARRAINGERITEAHRGHLYQVASRSGLSAPVVTLIHWGFATWGSVIAVVMAPSSPTMAICVVLTPQLVWTWIVRHRARRAGLAGWS
ncbi:glycosyl transferase [Lichenicola sp.]|uniref:glycosyl transferase n=1 Tax=Lichenicola sp. TaxID=2804529 RepID=UPI003B00EBFB